MPTAVASRTLVGGSLIAALLLLATARPPRTTARAADAPAAVRAAKEKAARDRERETWEARLIFYGEEDTGAWSLRVQDRAVRERSILRYTDLWKFDPESKKWVKVDDGAEAVRILP